MRHGSLSLAVLVWLLTLAGCATPRGLCRGGTVPINPTTGEHQP
jgi:hypothetical protein